MPRHSSIIKTELERQKLSLVSATSIMTRCEEIVTKAKTALADAEEKLRELRAAGFQENSAPIQKLRGSSFRSKATDLPVHQDGVIDRLNQAISEHAPRLAMLEENVTRENKRLKPILAKLEAELAEALRLERVSEAR